MKQGIIWRLLAASLLVLVAENALAQVEHDPSERIDSDRSWIIVSWHNSGSMGGWNLGSGLTGEPDMFMYPGWNNLPSGNAHSGYTRKNGTAVGFGTWLLSREGSAFRLSWSGPRSKSLDIVNQMYDPAAGPEKDLGPTTPWAQTRAGNYASAGNYWPGAMVPAIGPPRKINNFLPGSYIGDDAFAEQLLLTKWTTDQGITVTRKVHNWSYQDFDDFLIVELYLTNETAVTKEDVYVPLLCTWNVSEFGHRLQSTWWWTLNDRTKDDWFKYTEAGNYSKGNAGGPVFIEPSRARGLKLSYQFDGRSPYSGYDDTGEPWVKDLEAAALREMGVPDGMMTSFQFVGMAPVAYADNAGVHSFNAADQGRYVQPVGEQPSHVNWWRIRGVNDYDEPTPEGNTPAQIFEALTAVPSKDNPTDVGLFTNAQVYGPYTIPPGQTAKLVVAYVAGSGAEYGAPGGEPMDPWQWSLTATAADVAKGEQAIVEHLEHALFAYQSGYDLPDAPPDVDMVIKSDENAKIKLMWSAAAQDAVNPDYAEKDIAGYRIYRGLRGTLTAIGPYNLMVDIPVGGPYPPGVTYNASASWPEDAAETDALLRNTLTTQGDSGRRPAAKGMYSWSDPSSNAGFTYYYSIRAYAKGHNDWVNNDGTKTIADLPARAQKHLKTGLEGGYSQGGLQTGVGSPVLPFVEAADRMERKVVVVPNPYYADGTHEYGGDVKIRFLNVPSKCFIYIFNSAGQLIEVLRKLDATRSEISWTGRPYSTLQAKVGAGIYFYAVHSVSDASDGKIQTGTFIVVR